MAFVRQRSRQVLARLSTANDDVVGANFLIPWKGPSEIDEPLIEAVMVGQSGNAGISFTSFGRKVSEAPR